LHFLVFRLLISFMQGCHFVHFLSLAIVCCMVFINYSFAEFPPREFLFPFEVGSRCWLTWRLYLVHIVHTILYFKNCPLLVQLWPCIKMSPYVQLWPCVKMSPSIHLWPYVKMSPYHKSSYDLCQDVTRCPALTCNAVSQAMTICQTDHVFLGVTAVCQAVTVSPNSTVCQAVTVSPAALECQVLTGGRPWPVGQIGPVVGSAQQLAKMPRNRHSWRSEAGIVLVLVV